MLDINYYRFAEEKAKNSIPTWLISKKYNLEVFEKEGFPVRLNNIQQLKQIFNTMQENRFNIYMKELKGFSKKDTDIFIDALKKSIAFQKNFFPRRDLILPLDTLIAFFVIYKKLHALNPNAKTILEIGPGSGYSSFFLNKFKLLENYTYTDACESFYMLQNYINFFMFKEDFVQHAIEDEDNRIYLHNEIISYEKSGIEKDICIKYENSHSTQYHAYPWWRLKDLAQNDIMYDLVTSNANLLEFSEGALNDYFSIIKQKLSHGGMFFVHCPGYNLIRDFEYIIEKLYEFKLAIVFYAKWTVEYNCKQTNKKLEKRFRVPNIVIVNDGHDLFESFYGKKDIMPFMPSGKEEIDSVFLPNSDYYHERTVYTKEDIKNILLKKDNRYEEI